MRQFMLLYIKTLSKSHSGATKPIQITLCCVKTCGSLDLFRQNLKEWILLGYVNCVRLILLFVRTCTYKCAHLRQKITDWYVKFTQMFWQSTLLWIEIFCNLQLHYIASKRRKITLRCVRNLCKMSTLDNNGA